MKKIQLQKIDKSIEGKYLIVQKDFDRQLRYVVKVITVIMDCRIVRFKKINSEGKEEPGILEFHYSTIDHYNVDVYDEEEIVIAALDL